MAPQESGKEAEFRELTRGEWSALNRPPDLREIFSRQEVEAALRFVMSPRQAASTARAIYRREPGSPGVTFFHGDMFSALSLVSADAAERVREVLKETKEDAEMRVGAFRASLKPAGEE